MLNRLFFWRSRSAPSALTPEDDTATEFWTVPDLIDFNYYVDTDELALRESSQRRREPDERDRRLYLETIKPQLKTKVAEHTPTHRRITLRRWLGQRRSQEDPDLRLLLPGASFARGQRLIGSILGILGVVFGAILTSALLQYDGHSPVNVSWYLFILVGLQLLLVAATVTAWSLRRSMPVQQAIQDISLLARLIRPLFSRLAGWVQQHRLSQLPPSVRDKAQAQGGLLHAHYALYGPASYLPVLIPLQVFGIGFNLGILLMTLVRILFTDLSFGWGTALNLDPAFIYHLTRTIALPWSWLFGEGSGFPSLEAIEGSRILLKDSLSWSNDEYLRAWRWFLLLAVITYGLVPRLILLAVASWVEHYALATLPFTHQRTQAVYARLLAPSLEITVQGSGIGAEMPIPTALKLDHPPAAPPTAVKKPTEQIAADACFLLLHTDVAEVLTDADHQRLQQLLQQQSGWQVGIAMPFGGRRPSNTEVLARLGAVDWAAPPARVALIKDGSQPPITEHLRFLREVRALIGDQAQLLLALIGDPEDDDPLPPVSAFDFNDWQRKIDQMGDPYLRLVMLTEQEGTDD